LPYAGLLFGLFYGGIPILGFPKIEYTGKIKMSIIHFLGKNVSLS